MKEGAGKKAPEQVETEMRSDAGSHKLSQAKSLGEHRTFRTGQGADKSVHYMNT